LSDSLTTKLSATSVSGRANDSGVKMADYTLISSNINYAFSDTKEIYFRIENLLDEQYQTAAGYGTSDRAFYIGFRASY
jgi:vitamin B12 transporter